MIRLTLPYPPSMNRYWRTWKGRVLLSAEGRAYKQKVALVSAGVEPFTGPVSVSVRVYRPRKVGDLDNTLKALLDGLKQIAFVDDSQVVRLQAERFDDRDNPRAEVEVVDAGGGL